MLIKLKKQSLGLLFQYLFKVQNDITEDELEQKLETLNRLKEQQKQLFMIVIKRFIEIISDHLNKPHIKIEENEIPSLDSNPNWIKWIGERFEDFLITV